MNDWKSPPAKGLTSGADGGPRTQGEIYNINYSACCTLARNLIFKRLPYPIYKNLCCFGEEIDCGRFVGGSNPAPLHLLMRMMAISV